MIPKTKFKPLDHIKPNKNFHNTNTIIQENNIRCIKEPQYFYKKKKVIDNNTTQESYNFDYSNDKQEIKPLFNPYQNNNNKKNLDLTKIQNQKFTFNRDINVCSDLRGNCSRLSNKQFNYEKESIENDRFQFLTKNFQDPNKIVMDFPRGGDTTRKTKNIKPSDGTNRNFTTNIRQFG